MEGVLQGVWGLVQGMKQLATSIIGTPSFGLQMDHSADAAERQAPTLSGGVAAR
jgi:hypothetical protein